MSRFLIRATLGATAAITIAAGLTGCSTDDAPANQAAATTISDQWVKAADRGMTAAFGEIANTGDTEVNVVSATSPANGRMEIHEMATDAGGQMVMRPKQGGLRIAAHSSTSLKPGGDHLMFMDIPKAISAGDTVEVTLTFGDGSTKKFSAQARDFNGNQENYSPGTGSDTPQSETQHG